MATKKDLVEAYSYSRRRLVTAFVSGAPGGREVEPTRPGRALIGGVALAVLLIAGGAVLGILKSPTVVEWDDEQVISEKESGAGYLVLDNAAGTETEVRPLVNITSALLIFGPELSPTRVPRAEIDSRPPGASIGILGAPQIPPQASDLVPSGWTACTGVIDSTTPSGLKLRISTELEVEPDPSLVFGVRTESGRVYVVAPSRTGFERGERAYSYEVPDTPGRARILDALTGDVEPVSVPDEWIGLFPAGGALDLATFGIPADRYAARWSGAGSIPGTDKARNGDLLVVGDASYLLTPDGVVQLDEFARTLYAALEYPRGKQPRSIEVSQAPASITNARDLPLAFWPSEVRGDLPPVGQLCARLDVQGDQPGVVLATTTDDSPASAVGVEAGSPEVSVEPGKGAFVFSGDWEEGGPSSPFLVDPRGFAYPVGPGEEQFKLGYGDVERVVVPNAWIGLLGEGVALTIDAARCPPTSDPRGGCS